MESIKVSRQLIYTSQMYTKTYDQYRTVGLVTCWGSAVTTTEAMEYVETCPHYDYELKTMVTGHRHQLANMR